MAARRFMPTAFEFSQSGGTTWTEIPEVEFVDVPDPEAERFEGISGRRYFLYSRREYAVGSLNVNGAWVTTLLTAQNNGDNNITLRITHAGGKTETISNCSVEVLQIPARPDRPAMVIARFYTASYNGSDITFSA